MYRDEIAEVADERLAVAPLLRGARREPNETDRVEASLSAAAQVVGLRVSDNVWCEFAEVFNREYQRLSH